MYRGQCRCFVPAANWWNFISSRAWFLIPVSTDRHVFGFAPASRERGREWLSGRRDLWRHEHRDTIFNLSSNNAIPRRFVSLIKISRSLYYIERGGGHGPKSAIHFRRIFLVHSSFGVGTLSSESLRHLFKIYVYAEKWFCEMNVFIEIINLRIKR